MVWFFGKCRRSGGRSGIEVGGERLVDEAGALRRRECQRVYLPAMDTLEIIKSTPEFIQDEFRVLDIVSEKAVGMVRVGSHKHPIYIRMGQMLQVTVMFHDGNCYEIGGKVVRYCSDLSTQNEKLVCLLVERIPKEIIDSEMEYLRDNYSTMLCELGHRAEKYADLVAAI